jgi:hypothetical protein
VLRIKLGLRLGVGSMRTSFSTHLLSLNKVLGISPMLIAPQLRRVTGVARSLFIIVFKKIRVTP